MKILVTGATGFIGRQLISELIKQNYEVVCLVRSKEKAKELLKKNNVAVVIGDVTKYESLSCIPMDIEVVIHLAAIGHVSAISQEAFELFTSTNETGTANLIKILQEKTKLKKFIYFSSTAAMGPIGDNILNEVSRPNPLTPYQKSKYRSEQISINSYKINGFSTIVIRPCMVYGQGGQGEFYKFCRLMKKGVFPKIGGGKNLTPLVHVEDLISATINALNNGVIGETYIIASDSSIEMDYLHKLIMTNIGINKPYIYVPTSFALLGSKVWETICLFLKKEPIVTYRNIKSTVDDRTFDISKAKYELGYTPKITFEDGIKKTIEWYKEQQLL